MIEDTTAASFPMREAAVGLGPVGEDYTRGFWLHSTLAVRWQGHPEDPYEDQSQLIGLAGQSVWVRDITKSRRKEKKADRLRRQDRESARWGKRPWSGTNPVTEFQVTEPLQYYNDLWLKLMAFGTGPIIAVTFRLLPVHKLHCQCSKRGQRAS